MVPIFMRVMPRPVRAGGSSDLPWREDRREGDAGRTGRPDGPDQRKETREEQEEAPPARTGACSCEERSRPRNKPAICATPRPAGASGRQIGAVHVRQPGPPQATTVAKENTRSWRGTPARTSGRGGVATPRRLGPALRPPAPSSGRRGRPPGGSARPGEGPPAKGRGAARAPWRERADIGEPSCRLVRNAKRSGGKRRA